MTPDVAVIGHVEWVTHVRGDMPGPGAIVHLADPLEEPAGGGAVSAAQVAKLGARCDFFTALGDDMLGDTAARRLADEGVTVHAVRRAAPQTRAVSATGAAGDRAIAVLGPPLVASPADPLPWHLLRGADAAYFTGHDPAALVAARSARLLVVTARRVAVLAESGVRADVVVASSTDAGEQVAPGDLPVEPGALVWTAGAAGGTYRCADGTTGRWDAAAPPGAAVDSYGCGDSFVAGVTVGLARGWDLDRAIALGARCGAACLTGRGALAPQLREEPGRGRTA